MSFPAIVTTNTSKGDSFGTSHTVNLPSGITAGDLLIICFGMNHPGGRTVTNWNGFTEFFTDPSQAGTPNLFCAYKKATGSEGSTINITTSDTCLTAHTSYRITGGADPAIQAPQASAGASGFSANVDPDTATPTGGAKDYLWIAVGGITKTSGSSMSSAPANYSNMIQGANTGDGQITASAERQLNAASENPGTFVASAGQNWQAATLVIHPISLVNTPITPGSMIRGT